MKRVAAVGRRAGGRGLAGFLLDLASVTKPRVVSLLVWTGATSGLAAAGGWPGGATLLGVVVGGGMAAGGAGAINCAIDRDIDAVMQRTRHRPIPAGRLSPEMAVGLGIGLNGAAFVLLVLLTNVWAALLAVGGSLWYVFVYSLWLKRRTPSNIVIGGVAGSFPPLVGWSAVTGGIGPTALVLALVIFLWTPPHFWSLAALMEPDYRRAGVPMLPVLVGPTESARRMLRYAVATVATSLIPLTWGGLGFLYGVVALAVGGWFVLLCVNYRHSPSVLGSRRVFVGSLVYLFVLFAAAAADRWLWAGL